MGGRTGAGTGRLVDAFALNMSFSWRRLAIEESCDTRVCDVVFRDMIMFVASRFWLLLLANSRRFRQGGTVATGGASATVKKGVLCC